MQAPLYSALREFAETRPLRMHMPGHKGKPLLCPELAAVSRLDFTELAPTGNLYEPGGPIDEAQQLWARAWGMDWCQFLTGGSTQGNHTAMSLCAMSGERVLVDRGSHRSVYHSLALLDLDPVYLSRPWLGEEGISGPISPADVEKLLEEHADIKTVCITSPTYYGVLSNVKEISQVVHRFGGKLIVDGAHGAHLPFLGNDAFSGADLVVASAHKTLPALGQGAVLLGRGGDRERVRRTAAIYGSSSPSYPILASLDLARAWMEGAGVEEYRRVIARTRRLRVGFPGIRAELSLDPARLTLAAKDGHRLAQALREAGVYPEMAEGGHVVFILTGCDGDEDLARLERELERLVPLLGRSGALPPPPVPQRILRPRKALFAPSETLELEQCQGRVAACQLAPYPPGIPVVAPGEMIEKKELSYFRRVGYNNRVTQVVIP